MLGRRYLILQYLILPLLYLRKLTPCWSLRRSPSSHLPSLTASLLTMQASSTGTGSTHMSSSYAFMRDNGNTPPSSLTERCRTVASSESISSSATFSLTPSNNAHPLPIQGQHIGIRPFLCGIAYISHTPITRTKYYMWRCGWRSQTCFLWLLAKPALIRGGHFG